MPPRNYMQFVIAEKTRRVAVACMGFASHQLAFSLLRIKIRFLICLGMFLKICSEIYLLSCALCYCYLLFTISQLQLHLHTSLFRECRSKSIIQKWKGKRRKITELFGPHDT